MTSMREPAVSPGRVALVAPPELPVRQSQRRPLRARMRGGRSQPPSPALSEEQAIELLYGERSGTVSASTAGPPLAGPHPHD